MTPQDFFTANLPLIERVIAIVCRRAGVLGADRDDFASHVKLRIIDDDYAVIRKYEGRSSFESYLTVVIQRMLADGRIEARGRFRPSSVANRLGPLAILLEKLVVRDRRRLDEAMPHLRAVDATATPEQLLETLKQLPERPARPREVAIDGVEEIVPGVDAADARAIAADVQRLARRAEQTLRQEMAQLPPADRALIRFHFAEEMTVAEIARVLQTPQRPLYRRLESLLQQLRGALTSAGIDRRVVADLVDSGQEELDFGLTEKNRSTPVHHMEET